MRKVPSLLIALALCFSVAGIGGMLTSPGLPWLETLHKPSFYPPNRIFGPVWTVLYTMIAVSGWLIHGTAPSPQRAHALVVFGVQLALNGAWSLLFFYLRQPGWALLDIVALLCAICAYIFQTSKLNHAAA